MPDSRSVPGFQIDCSRPRLLNSQHPRFGITTPLGDAVQ